MANWSLRSIRVWDPLSLGPLQEERQTEATLVFKSSSFECALSRSVHSSMPSLCKNQGHPKWSQKWDPSLIGTPILKALLSSQFSITALTRTVDDISPPRPYAYYTTILHNSKGFGI